MSITSVMYTVRELIDKAFGNEKKNTVNFKLIQTVLYLLARDLRILERRVQINLDKFTIEVVPSTLSVTEIKVFAKVPKNKGTIKNALELPEPGEKGKKSTKDRADSDKKSRDKTSKGTVEQQRGSTDKDVARKASKESKKTSIEKILTQKPVSKKASDEKITPGKSVKVKDADKEKGDKTKSQKAAEISEKKTTSQIFKQQSTEGHKTLEQLEMEREKELRVIHQRATSYVEALKSPTPMASLDSTEIQYEKLLIVERVPSREASKMYQQDRTSKLAVVSQEQFDALVDTVAELQSQIEPVATPIFPDNIQLMKELRKGASLTDAMAALQLSARVENVEHTVEKMAGLLTYIVQTQPEMKGVSDEKKPFGKDVVVFHAVTGTKRSEPDEISLEIPITKPEPPVQHDSWNVKGMEKYITYDDLENALDGMYNEFFKAVTACTTKSNANSEKALKLAHSLDSAIETALNLDNRMNYIEGAFSEYADQINSLDTGLTAQMTQYQEQLNQMQHDLESGLENMAESLTTQGGDTEAVTELNDRFTILHNDIDAALSMKKDLLNVQDTVTLEIDSLRREIDIFRETKCDRDEVADALRDKADMKDLNGLLHIEHFEAVKGVIEKNISAAYLKFNSQELVWQNALDDISKELHEKAQICQVEALFKEIQQNLDQMKARIDGIAEIMGEPKTAAMTRQIFRDAACLSCSTPAHMHMEEPDLIPALPPVRLPLIGSEAPSKPTEDGDHRLCYPGMIIPHSKDPRARFCSRYCGGSHTIQSAQARLAPSLGVRREMREFAVGIGSDGRSYMLDEKIIRKPCIPCNPPINSVEDFPETTAGDMTESTCPCCPCCLQKRPAPVRDVREVRGSFERDMSSLDPRDMLPQAMDQASVTPPAMFDYD